MRTHLQLQQSVRRVSMMDSFGRVETITGLLISRWAVEGGECSYATLPSWREHAWSIGETWEFFVAGCVTCWWILCWDEFNYEAKTRVGVWGGRQITAKNADVCMFGCIVTSLQLSDIFVQFWFLPVFSDHVRTCSSLKSAGWLREKTRILVLRAYRNVGTN